MHFLYILFSASVDRFYIGETDNIDKRLIKHNSHFYKDSFTKIAEDWEVALLFECTSRDQAVRLEKFIKRMKSKVFIQKIIANPEMLADIISKNKF